MDVDRNKEIRRCPKLSEGYEINGQLPVSNRCCSTKKGLQVIALVVRFL